MGEQTDVKDRALAAIAAALAAHTAARNKITQVIFMKGVNGQDARREEARRADLDVTIGNLENERAEYRAATSVVHAPTVAEIAAMRSRIQEIRDLAVSDAALQAGLGLLGTVLKASIDLKNQNSLV
jgi:hypothetical protein